MADARASRILTVGSWLLAVVLASSAAISGAIGEGASEAQRIETLLEQQTAAWNRGDLEAFCALYATDALFLSPSGLTRGREQILARYRSRYADRRAMGRLALELIEVDLAVPSGGGPAAGAAVAARWTLSYPDRDDASGLTLIVMRRTGDEWRIIYDASM
jgi:uncharacterized protein (TIGR02246 family)